MGFGARSKNPGDVLPPTVPAPVAQVSGYNVRISWNASTDPSGVARYWIRKKGSDTQLEITATAREHTYTEAIGQHQYEVSAEDAYGNLSRWGSTGVASVVDVTAPTASTLTAIAFSTTEIDLSWTLSTDNVAVAGYKAERSTTGTSGWTSIYTGTARSFRDSGLKADTTYFYRVHAYDAAGNMSAYDTRSTKTKAPTLPPILI